MKVVIRCWCALFFGAAAMLGLIAAHAQANQASDNRTTGTVLLIARDRSGQLVRNLKPENLTVVDNGHAAKILGVEPAGKLPVRIGILLTGDQFTFKLQQKAAIRLLGSLRPDGDQAFVLTHASSTNPRPWPSKNLVWQSDPKTLSAFVESLQWNEGFGSTRGAVMAMLALNPEKPFRRVMLEIRDPGQELSRDFDYAIAHKVDEFAEFQRMNVIVYTSPVWSTMRYSGSRDGFVRIEKLAIKTGGRDLDFQKLESEVTGVREDLDNQMLVSFELQPGDAQKAHTLEIRCNRKDVKITSQNRYYPTTAQNR
jgi:hypothetical protein